jgi:hypothetical protein
MTVLAQLAKEIEPEWYLQYRETCSLTVASDLLATGRVLIFTEPTNTAACGHATLFTRSLLP